MNFNLESNADSLSAPEYILQNFEASDRIAVLVRSRIAGETIQRDYNGEKCGDPGFSGVAPAAFLFASRANKSRKVAIASGYANRRNKFHLQWRRNTEWVR
jgi:hypothetical protein